MAQLPPDSQLATWSHSPSVAAPACPARARLPVPMTAPVKAILATFTADAVGLRCRPLIGALVSSLRAREVSCRVRAGEVARPAASKRRGFTPRSRKRLLVLLFGGPVGPPPPSKVVRCWPCPDGWSSARSGHGGPPDWGRGAWERTVTALPASRHLLPVTAFPVPANPKRALNAQDVRRSRRCSTAAHHLVASL